MTKKHFIALADKLRPIRDRIPAEVLEVLQDFCRVQNPRFLASRWTGYLAGTCGPNGGAVRYPERRG